MVLVCDSLHNYRCSNHLSPRSIGNAKTKRDFIAYTSPSCSNDQDRNDLSRIKAWWLVLAISTWKEYGSFGVQRFYQWAVQQARKSERRGCSEVMI